jgi:hypothetical protein
MQRLVVERVRRRPLRQVLNNRHASLFAARTDPAISLRYENGAGSDWVCRDGM